MRCLADSVLPVTRLQKPRLHAPRTRASLANSLQSDLRWMMILVPVLTPEASAISNTPELRHIQKRESQFHTLLLTKPIWQVWSLSLGIFTSRAQTGTERKGKVALFLNPAEPPSHQCCQGQWLLRCGVWGSPAPSGWPLPIRSSSWALCQAGARHWGERDRAPETSPPSALTLCVSEPLAQAT